MSKITAGIAGIVLAASLMACAPDNDEQVYQQTCVTQDDMIQVDAFNCEFNGGFGYIWYWYPVTLGVQQNGYHHTSGYKTKPAHGKVYTPHKPYVAPVKTSGGMKTAGPVKTAGAGKPVQPYKNPPARKR